jgi:hypothetical protein
VDQWKFLLSSWPHLYGESFASNSQTLQFIYPLLSQILLSNWAWCAVNVNRFLTYPLKQDVSHLSDQVLLLNRVAILLFCSGSSLLGCPIHIQSSTINVSPLQHRWHCYNFYSVVAAPCLAVPFTFKAAQFSVSPLQHRWHCYNF